MFTIVLYQLEIPPNTGNIIRLCADTGADLYLVKPFGLPPDSSKMRRAGLDYHEFVKLTVHKNFGDCLKALKDRRIFALTTKDSTRPGEVSFREGDVLSFGPETCGLPVEVLDNLSAGQKIHLPVTLGSRSMNLSSTVAVILFEAWRQDGFVGGV